jgi:hypothetical protein
MIEINKTGSQFLVSDYFNNSIAIFNGTTFEHVTSEKYTAPTFLMTNCKRILFKNLRSSQFTDITTNTTTNYTALFKTTVALKKLNELLFKTEDIVTRQTYEINYEAIHYDLASSRFFLAGVNHTVFVANQDLEVTNTIGIYPYNVKSFASYGGRVYAATDADKFLVLYNNRITNKINATCSISQGIRRFSVDANGYIIFPCYSERSVVLIDQNGTELRERINTPGLRPLGVLLDSIGRIFAFGDSNIIQIFYYVHNSASLFSLRSLFIYSYSLSYYYYYFYFY